MNILYNGIPALDAGIITIPLVLYQGSQVVLGQGVVAIMRAWMRRVTAQEEKSLNPLPSQDTVVEKHLDLEDVGLKTETVELSPV